MANAHYLMNVRIAGQVGQARTIELTRPRSKPWQLALPAALDQEPVSAALVDFVTAQFLVDVPAAGLKLGWETIYALVRTALLETQAEHEATSWAARLRTGATPAPGLATSEQTAPEPIDK